MPILTKNFQKPESDQRTYLTIVFSDLSESTRIAADIEPEIYADLLEKLREIFVKTIERHGGEIIRIDGDGFVFIFGHATSYEDAGRRATEAAIDLHDAAAALDHDFAAPGIAIRLHTGIHSGVVLLRPGDMARGRYEILGDATNITARLCDLAAAGQIIVSEETLGADRYFFSTGRRRVVGIRGNQRQLVVFDVLGRDVMPNRFTARVKRGVAPFVGRKAELDKLQQHLDSCKSGENCLTIVTGNAGIGKTRLVAEFLEQAAEHGVSTHQGYCEAYLSARPLQPFSQLVHSILTLEYGLPSDADAEKAAKYIKKIDQRLVAPLLQFLFMEASGSDQLPPQLGTLLPALIALLSIEKTDKPLILFIDDWQWADGASKKAMETVLSSVTRPIFFLLAMREHDELTIQMSKAEILEISPLAVNEAKLAIEGLVSTPGPFAIERIVDQSGGSPLFIEELCHSVQHGEENNQLKDRGEWLDALIHSRFSRLPEEQAKLVKIASVIGHMIPSWLFEQVTGVGIGHPMLVSLAEKDFIYTSDFSGTLRFKHGATREAIYRIVGLHDRQAMHGRIVDAIHNRTRKTGDGEQLEALAYHYWASGNAERGAHYAVLAGDRAMAASALDRAQNHYKSALESIELLGDSPELVKQAEVIVRKYGLACVVDPSRDQLPTLEHATNKAAASNNYEALAWAEYWLGFILYGLGEAKDSITHLETARRAALVCGDEKLITQIQANLGQAHATACEYEPALVWLNEAIDIKRKHRSGTRTSIGLSYSLSCKAFVLADQGMFDEAYGCFDEAIETLAGAEHEMTASVLSQRSASCLWQGRYSEARQYAEHAQKIAGRVKARYLFAMSRALSATAQWCDNNDVEVLETIIETTKWLESNANQQFISLNFGWLAEALESCGQLSLARRYAAHAQLRARKGDRLGQAMAFRAMARASAKENETRPAERYLSRAYYAAKLRNSPHEDALTKMCHAEIVLQQGKPEMAMPMLVAASETFEALGMKPQMKLARQFILATNR